MILANYINDLLYRYDCVIVPDFGGFVTNKIGAKVNNFTHTFYPPTKQISFNNHLKHNDGLLANYIASVENITFEKASNVISLSVTKWQNQLQTKAIEIKNIGRLSLNDEKKIIFEPNNNVNYLTESFGLSIVESPAIKKYKENVKPLIPVVKEENKKGIPSFIKYAATAAILLTLSFAGYNGYKQNQQKEILANQEKALEKKIQTATFVISNPLPTINLNVAKEISKPYHIIAGAFRLPSNAEKKVKQLNKKGYKAIILGKNNRGLTLVAYDSFSNIETAQKELKAIKRILFDYDAWLLVKRF